MSKFKKGDKIKCISNMIGLEYGKEYEVLKPLDDAVILCGIKDYAYFDCDFKKIEPIKKIKKLDDMQIINANEYFILIFFGIFSFLYCIFIKSIIFIFLFIFSSYPAEALSILNLYTI